MIYGTWQPACYSVQKAAKHAACMRKVLNSCEKGRSVAAYVQLIVLLLKRRVDVKRRLLGKAQPAAVAGPWAHGAPAHLRRAHVVPLQFTPSNVQTSRITKQHDPPNHNAPTAVDHVLKLLNSRKDGAITNASKRSVQVVKEFIKPFTTKESLKAKDLTSVVNRNAVVVVYLVIPF